jgi:predicted  nucleic acid-binding Zn-ribbon protein
MNEIEHEGKIYILKSSVEGIVKDRVSKVAARASEAEARASEFEKQIKTFESKQASYDVLAQQVSDLKTQLQKSESKFSRYQSVSKIGITDQDVIDVLEFQYEKAMKNTKEKVSLGEWLEHHIDNYEEAPSVEASPEAPEAAHEENTTASMMDLMQMQSLQQLKQAQRPPEVNRGAVRAPEQKDILQRAMSDQDFYNANADAVRQAWFAKHNPRRS